MFGFFRRLGLGPVKSGEVVDALCVGLGNPGPEYENTRHNIGYLVITELLARSGAKLSLNRRAQALAGTVHIAGSAGRVPVVVARTTSFMNVSGGAVKALGTYYRLTPEQIIVVHDDLDLPFGTIRIKRGGGSGGHNGLKDVTRALGTPNYVRVRVGVDRPPGRMDPAAYVLRPFDARQREDLPLTIARAADAVELLVTVGLTAAQQKYHSET